jgi:hypothetical protein
MPYRFKIQTPIIYLSRVAKLTQIFPIPCPSTTMDDDKHGPHKDGGNGERLNSHRRAGESFTFQPSLQDHSFQFFFLLLNPSTRFHWILTFVIIETTGLVEDRYHSKTRSEMYHHRERSTSERRHPYSREDYRSSEHRTHRGHVSSSFVSSETSQPRIDRVRFMSLIRAITK